MNNTMQPAAKLSTYPKGDHFGANCPGCGDLTIARAMRGGSFRVVKKCPHFVAVRLFESVEIEFAARRVALD